ncbi:MAG: MiaB/RimO family radical SAM methylthiotransferase [candidate division WOR-3 bacterium]
MKSKKNFSFFPLTLGCSKNQVDIEYLLGELTKEGHLIVEDIDRSDFVLINTCSFINDARVESEKIAKKISKTKKVILIGCYVQMFKDKVFKIFPNINLFIGTESGQFKDFILENLNSKKKLIKLNDNTKIFFSSERYPLNRFHTYIKISEGCFRKCSFCKIPSIRGTLRSKRIEEILKEVENFSKKGFQEFELISEDSSLYGVDLYKRRMILKLIEKLDKNFPDRLFRLLYVYPDNAINDIVSAIKESKSFIKYIDVPFQHVSYDVLKSMKRENIDVFEISNMIKNSGLILRSSFIVGFPQEKERDFQKLKDFIKRGYIDKLGLFLYSNENEEIENTIDFSKKIERFNKLININKKIAIEKMKANIGKYKNVVFYYSDNEYTYGRLIEDAPDIDDIVVTKNKDIEKFKVLKLKIKDVKGYTYFC